MKKQKFPPGWDEKRVKEFIAHYENQTEDEEFADIEAAREADDVTLMAIPTELVPEVRALLAQTECMRACFVGCAGPRLAIRTILLLAGGIGLPDGVRDIPRGNLPMGKRVIHVGHSPDPDDAFMFYALAHDKLDTGDLEFRHELQDIETLNRRALRGELEVTAISIHAYASLLDRYALLPSGCSMGDRYGPMVVARRPLTVEQLASIPIAVPGTMTTAFLALRLLLPAGFRHEVVPFDQIIPAVAAGKYDAGLIIHEGQLTFQNQGLHLIVDLGVWWQERTGLPLPLGGNVVRRDLGPDTIRHISRLLKESIRYGLDHRQDALSYALQYARDMDRGLADQFVGMYVNDWTLDYGPRGREAVAQLLDEAYRAGIIARPVQVDFVD